MKIKQVKAREVLDSRGNPTVSADVVLEDGSFGTAMCPSGASTGEKEAVELRDGDQHRYNGKGVLKAVSNINDEISNALTGRDVESQEAFDKLLIELDGTPFKSKLGANALLPVSMAFSRAMSHSRKVPLYRQLYERRDYIMPVPCMNVINGGRHADNNLDFQEFMIAPHNASSFREAIRMGEETFHALKGILKAKGYYTGVGDEGGFAPNLSTNEEAVELILESIVKAGYDPGKDISICLDPAASEMWDGSKYLFYKSTQQRMESSELISLWQSWVTKYPIVLLEDGMGEDDWQGWKQLTQAMGKNIELVGDDIFCTNPAILQKGIDERVANSILIKLNQIGTVTETLDTIRLANKHGYHQFLSHRSGETEDTFLADLAVASNAGHLKTGSGCRSERIAKYNRLLLIEEELGVAATFADGETFKNWNNK
ncbi:phosphopyruvate hydratase [Taibaiella soli]|uniref:Enolase n=1 Tax=Taibaiella soli TaxID=1649169 RepID=A0A2W2AUG9_9BACT|nr:phosphopyruvate hydratase [Taibaiella soli]PZF71624.1 phosphopyruvate hydratase [Taibaiella soli]